MLQFPELRKDEIVLERQFASALLSILESTEDATRSFISPQSGSSLVVTDPAAALAAAAAAAAAAFIIMLAGGSIIEAKAATAASASDAEAVDVAAASACFSRPCVVRRLSPCEDVPAESGSLVDIGNIETRHGVRVCPRTLRRRLFAERFVLWRLLSR